MRFHPKEEFIHILAAKLDFRRIFGRFFTQFLMLLNWHPVFYNNASRLMNIWHRSTSPTLSYQAAGGRDFRNNLTTLRIIWKMLTDDQTFCIKTFGQGNLLSNTFIRFKRKRCQHVYLEQQIHKFPTNVFFYIFINSSSYFQ